MTSEPYRILIEQSPDGMVIAQDNVITFANAAAARLCGAANEHALIGRPLLEIFVPSGTSGRAIRMQRFARAAAGEHVAPFEDQLDQPDGGFCDVEIAVARLALLDESVAGHHARDAGDLRAQARRGGVARERGAPDARVRRSAGRRLGLEPADRRRRLFAALEADARLRRGRDRAARQRLGTAAASRRHAARAGAQRQHQSRRARLRRRVPIASQGRALRPGPLARIPGTQPNRAGRSCASSAPTST